jgi:cytochrome c5
VRASHRRRILALAAALVAPACAAALRHPTERDAQAVAARWPGTTTADLARGRTLYVRRCAGCHTVPLPAVHTAEEWPGVIGEMAARARLTPEARRDIERFLVALSAEDAAPLPVSR